MDFSATPTGFRMGQHAHQLIHDSLGQSVDHWGMGSTTTAAFGRGSLLRMVSVPAVLYFQLYGTLKNL